MALFDVRLDAIAILGTRVILQFVVKVPCFVRIRYRSFVIWWLAFPLPVTNIGSGAVSSGGHPLFWTTSRCTSWVWEFYIVAFVNYKFTYGISRQST